MNGAELLGGALSMRRQHLSPFLVLGDPDPETSLALCAAAIRNGATMLELGLPFATPSADGPTVQAASARALVAGVRTATAFEVLAALRAKCPDVPCNLLVYGNLVHARGVERFCGDAARAGASSLLVPDVPLEEGHALRAACRAHGLANVMLAGPRTAPARLEALADEADGFVYLTGHQGVTGARAGGDGDGGGDGDARHARTAHVAAQLRARRPGRALCVGFGLRSRADVAATFAAGAQVAVVGSHLIRVVERHLSAREHLLRHFAGAVRELLPAPVTTADQSCSSS